MFTHPAPNSLVVNAMHEHSWQCHSKATLHDKNQKHQDLLDLQSYSSMPLLIKITSYQALITNYNHTNYRKCNSSFDYLLQEHGVQFQEIVSEGQLLARTLLRPPWMWLSLQLTLDLQWLSYPVPPGCNHQERWERSRILLRTLFLIGSVSSVSPHNESFHSQWFEGGYYPLPWISTCMWIKGDSADNRWCRVPAQPNFQPTIDLRNHIRDLGSRRKKYLPPQWPLLSHLCHLCQFWCFGWGARTVPSSGSKVALSCCISHHSLTPTLWR